MATVHEIEQRLFSWAPRESAMDWDNVGHLVGDPEQEVERILVALDITERVVQELSHIHIRRCRRPLGCRSRWSPYH